MEKRYWRLEAPIDHPLEGLADLRFQRVAQLKKHLARLDLQIDRCSVEKRHLDNLDEINGDIFESRSEDVNHMIPGLVDQIEEAEIERMETIRRAAQVFRDFAEVEIRLLDFVYGVLRLDRLLASTAKPQNLALPALLSQLSTLVSLNNNRTDLFIRLALGLGYDEELGGRVKGSDVSLLAHGSSNAYRGIRIGDRSFSYLEADWVKKVIGRSHVLPEIEHLL